MTKQRRLLYRMVTVGFMAALVYVGNYLQIKIPNGVLVTRIHLGNSMCLLAGLLFGGMSGGLSSGIGAAMFDLFDPVYIISSPYTFLSKFAMGFTAGFLKKKRVSSGLNVIIAAAAGQLVYIILYLIKSYFTVIIIGSTHEAALGVVTGNLAASSVNAVLAIVISVPLYFALARALKSTVFFELISKKEEKEKRERIFNPLTIALTIFSVVTMIIFSLNLAATNKIKDAEKAKEQALIERIEALESRVEELEE